jgi:uncharacterized protein (DUF302 family)
MNKIPLPLSVADATDRIKILLQEKGFELFADIDHRANAQAVNLQMPDSRVLIFGNPMAGTKLMQQDIFMSLDLPLRLAVVEHEGETLLLHQTPAYYCSQYQVADHPVLEKVAGLFSSLAAELSGG